MSTKSLAIVDRPQPLGILPSPWFWRDRENWKLVSGGLFGVALALDTLTLVGVVAATLVLGKGFLAGALGYLVVAPLVIAGGSALTLGVVERHVRKQVLARRRRAALGEAESSQ